MSDDTIRICAPPVNDNETPKHPADMPANDAPLTLEQQLSHGIMQLALHERQIRRFVLVKYPTGEHEPLGELLLRIGAQLFEERKMEEADAPKPRLALVPLAAPTTGLAQMSDLVKEAAKAMHPIIKA